MRDLLQHFSAEVRLAAARELDDVPQTPEVERTLIIASRDDSDAMVRKWSLHALGCAQCKPDGVCSTQVAEVFALAVGVAHPPRDVRVTDVEVERRPVRVDQAHHAAEATRRTG